GTLDPLATGLLILCTGRMTKRIEEFKEFDKEYTGTVTLGATTPSFDLESEVDEIFPMEHITEEMIKSAAEKLTGNYEQFPPIFSAIKINGKRAYEYARRDQEVVMLGKQVFVPEFEITSIEMPLIGFRIVCSKGTYIRSMAKDFGALLNSGAHLSSLCRTRIGPYSLKDALDPDGLKEAIRNS
ncbi:MAG: tRNA pseudouridine(55) synthase TruB, partial [Bacteroidota bacterium]